MLFLLLILLIDDFEYRDLLLTNSHFWYKFSLMGKVFLNYEKMLTDLLHWKGFIRLQLTLPLCWLFHKLHKWLLLCLHLVLGKVVKTQSLLQHLFSKVLQLFFPIICLKVSPIPIVQTPDILSKSIALQAKNVLRCLTALSCLSRLVKSAISFSQIFSWCSSFPRSKFGGNHQHLHPKGHQKHLSF